MNRLEFVYIIKHIPSGNYYIGSKYSKTKCNPQLFWKQGGYFTSSKIIKSLIKADGADSFKVIALRSCPNNDALKIETQFLRRWNIAARKNWINRRNNSLLDENL